MIKRIMQGWEFQESDEEDRFKGKKSVSHC